MSKSLRTCHHDAYKIMYMGKSAEISSLCKMKLSMIVKNNDVHVPFSLHVVNKHTVNHK